MADRPFRIGGIPDAYCRPVLYGIEERPASSLGGVVFADGPTNVSGLLKARLDAALLAPVDYARNSSELSLYPSLGVSSRGAGGAVCLCLHEQMRCIDMVAIGHASTTDVVLAKIVLAERFEQDVSFVPAEGSIEAMMGKASAALLSGDAAFTQRWFGPSIDLVDEWTDMTDLPFVHALVAGRNDHFDEALHLHLREAMAQGVASLGKAANDLALRLGKEPSAVEEYFGGFIYGFSDEARNGLSEFFRYAFYHGILPDIPDIVEFAPGS